MAEAILPCMDSFRVYMPILAEDMSVNDLWLPTDDVEESEVFILEASRSLLLLFWVWLDIE